MAEDPAATPAAELPAAPPSVQEVRGWLAVSPNTISDDQLVDVLAGERSAQAKLCRVEPWEPELTLALYRRCARAVAAMGLPLGVTGGDPEYGTAQIPRYDAEIERYERPFRKVVLG